jgi:serine/threonine protein kinase
LTNHEDDVLADLLVKWEDALEAGQEISIPELAQDHPDLIESLEKMTGVLRTTAWLKNDPARKVESDEIVNFEELTGVLSGRYQVNELIGRGGFGAVYKGIDLKLHRDIAIKVGLTHSSSELLVEEARKAAKLRHPNLVCVHDIGQHERSSYLIFDYIEGASLDKLLKQGPLKYSDAIELILNLCEPLEYAHRMGVIHRDIKPSNVLIGLDEQPMISDFGSSVTFEDVANNKIVSAATWHYMSPEQASGDMQMIAPQTDIHALGMLLFELLTGRLPYQAQSKEKLREAILFKKPLLLRELDPGIPQELEAVVAKCLSKHPDDRYASAGELSDCLTFLG